MNLFAIVLTGIVVLALLAWIIVVNKKEKKHLEQELNNDYPLPEKHKETADPDDVKGQ